MNYETIKALAKEHKCRVTDLIALAPQNDPFYVGQEAQREWAEWFAALYSKFGYSTGVHLRRIHSRIVSQDRPVMQPNGTAYENSLECWKALAQASKYARYLDLVQAEEFDDKRNPDPTDYQRTL